MLYPFCWLKNWGTEKLSILPKSIELVSINVGILKGIAGLQKVFLITVLYYTIQY